VSSATAIGRGNQKAKSRKQKSWQAGGKYKAESRNPAGREKSRNLLATEEEEAAIQAMLSKRAESAPAGAGASRAAALAWAGLKVAAMALLVAGVEVGYADGNEFDDVGCSVAQQPGGTSQGARSAQARERAGGGVPGSHGGSAGASGGGGPDDRPECEVRAAMCAHRMPDGLCQRSNRQCRLFAGTGEVREIMARMHREIATVRKDMVELRAARERLEGSDELDDEALRKIYAAILLTGMDEPGAREAPLKEVFDFYCVKGFSAQEVSVKLGCSKATVMNRLATLRQIAGVPASELRAYKPFFEQTEKILQEPRARRVRPEDALYGGE
jgi:hypothetical protein